MQEWDKQERESAKAYLAFSEYLQLDGRSLAKLELHLENRAVRGETKTSPKLAQLKKWSREQSWVSRAAAYDAHLVAQRLRSFEASQLERRVDIQEREWSASEALLKRVEEINRLPLTERIVTQEVMKDGRPVTQYITINPVKVAARDAARLADMASKLGRLSTGLETDRIKIDMEVQAQLEELLGELRTALTPSALAEIEAYLFARTGERPEERVLS